MGNTVCAGKKGNARGNLKKGDDMDDLGAAGMIILKHILKN
jgi:hypothetical protein